MRYFAGDWAAHPDRRGRPATRRRGAARAPRGGVRMPAGTDRRPVPGVRRAGVAGRADHRHRPARRGRPRPVPRPARAGNHRAGGVPDGARRAARPAVRLCRGRRRLPDQALRVRGAGRPPARPAPAQRSRRAPAPAACASIRSTTRRLRRRVGVAADADRVPVARIAGCARRRGRAPRRTRGGRLAARRDRPRQHPRRLHRPAQAQAPDDARRARTGNGARRRLLV